MSQEMNKPTIGKNENVEATPQSRTGDKPAEIIYREIRIVEPSAELVQDLKNKEKPITGLGHDKVKDDKPLGDKKGFAHDKPLGDKAKDQGFAHDKPLGDKAKDKGFAHDKPLADKTKDKGFAHDKPLGDKMKDKGFEHDKPHDRPEHFGDKYGAGKPVHDVGHDDSGLKVKTGPADLPDKLHGEKLKDKKYGDAPKHDKDAYVGNKPGDDIHKLKDGDRHDKHIGPDEQRYVGSDKHLAYPAEDREFKEARHIGDKYHTDKGRDVGQNLGQGYDDGATRKFVEKPLSPHDKALSPREKHIDGDKHLGDKPLSPRDKHVDGDKHHLLGKKHDHDKHKLKDDDGKKHKHLIGGKHDDQKLTDKDEPIDKHPKTHEPTIDKHKLKDGDVVAHGEKVKDKHQLKEADHIGDKYISKKGWDLGQNLGKKYDDADSYKLTDGHQYIPDKDKEVVRPGEAVTISHERGERVPHAPPVAPPRAPAAPAVAPPIPAVASDERVAVPSAHGEKVYELKDGNKHIGDDLREGDEHRKDKHLKDKDYATEETDESHKKHGVIGRAIEKVKEKFSSKSSAETTPVDPKDPTADKGHHWEKVQDKHSGEPVWKDRGVDKTKSTS